MKKSLTLFLVSLATASLISMAMAQQPDDGGQQQGGQRQNRQGQNQGQGNRNQGMNRQMGGMNRQPSAPTIKLGATGVFVVQASGVMKLDPNTLKPISQVALLPANATGATNSQRVPGPGDAPAAPAGGMGMMMSASCELGADDALYCVVGPYYVHIDGKTMKDVARFALSAVPAMPQQTADPQDPQAQNQQMMQMMQMMQPSQMQLKGNRLLVSTGGRVMLIDTTTDKLLATFPEAPAAQPGQ
ncbi:MAG: hypothetical protein ACYC1M_09385 [Armatimonadota bacterium]